MLNVYIVFLNFLIIPFLLCLTSAYELNIPSSRSFDFDVAIIGGGSAGNTLVEDLSRHGISIIIFDYVTPSHRGSVWGYGGTCVNVGCMPKKIFHHAAKVKHEYDTSGVIFGLASSNNPRTNSLSWSKLIETTQTYVKKLNFKYRKRVSQTPGVTYVNAHAKFYDAHTLVFTDPSTKKDKLVKSKFIIIANGSRPRLPTDIPGWQLGITSDDLFSLKSSPEKTLVVGGGYVAVESASALHQILGNGKVSLCLSGRSFLKGFDQEVSDDLDELLEAEGLIFLRFEEIQSLERDQISHRIKVKFNSGRIEIFDTVLFAVGRMGSAANLQIENVFQEHSKNVTDIIFDKESGTLKVESFETFVVWKHIFAAGDVVYNLPRLTKTAQWSAKIIAQSIYNSLTSSNKVSTLFNYPTQELSQHLKDTQMIQMGLFSSAVFSAPVEFGCLGLTEETAKQIFHKNEFAVSTKVKRFNRLEADILIRFISKVDIEGNELLSDFPSSSLVKIVFVSALNMQPTVVGVHILDSSASEIISALETAFYPKSSLLSSFVSPILNGFGVPLNVFETKTFGVHPTVAEGLFGEKKGDLLDCGGGSC